MAGDETYNIGPQAKDIDFYIGGISASSIIQSTLSVESAGTRIALASSSIDITSSSTPIARKISLTKISFDFSTSLTISSTEILQGLIHMDSQVSVSASVKKIAKGAALINISGSVAPSAKKITKASAHPDITSNLTGAGQQVKIAGSVSISGAVNVDFNPKEILLAKINVLIKSRVTANNPFRFSPNYIDSTGIHTFLILDGKPLTDHNRELDVSISPNFIENRNWHNSKSRYYKRSGSSGRKTFNISWKSVPNRMDYTVDTRNGRDYIASVAEESDSHVLKVINQDQSGLTPYTESTYTVFVRSYSESLVRRYIDEGVYLYDCSLVLEEA
jgi:hypothetical protein